MEHKLSRAELQDKIRQLENKVAEYEQIHAQLKESENRFRDIANNAKEVLRTREEHLRSLMESATCYVIYQLKYDPSLTRSLQVHFVSPSIQDILGFPEPMKFETWFDYVHPDDIQRIKLANKQASKTQRFDEECRVFNPKQGIWRWVHAIAAASVIKNGRNRYINGIIIDITDRNIAFRKLKIREKELEKKTRDLKQVNAALNVLLEKREKDKLQFEDKVSANINKLVSPFLARIRKRNLQEEQQALLDIIESNLKGITIGFSHRLASQHFGLTPTEIQVADLVRQGQKTKIIAEILNLSPKTIESHRESIRKKLGIKNRKVNLQTHLMSIK